MDTNAPRQYTQLGFMSAISSGETVLITAETKTNWPTEILSTVYPVKMLVVAPATTIGRNMSDEDRAEWCWISWKLNSLAKLGCR
jgi:hypothetical protein